MRGRWSLVMLVGMFVVLAVAGLVNGVQVRGQFECGARYDSALQERSQILTRIAAEDRQQSIAAEKAITQLITDVIAAGGDADKGAAAARRYLTTSAAIARKRQELERQRAAQPFPQPPEKACA
jgi:hypothetical protein